jgi:DNA replication protein DnaC
LGYLPIDKFGADCLFQIISHRYERGATLLTTNRKCGAPHFLFNAEGIVMQTPVAESLTFSLFRPTFAPHKSR